MCLWICQCLQRDCQHSCSYLSSLHGNCQVGRYYQRCTTYISLYRHTLKFGLGAISHFSWCCVGGMSFFSTINELSMAEPPWPILNRLNFGRGQACDLAHLKRWATRPHWPDDNAWYHVQRCKRQYFCFLTGTGGGFSITSMFTRASWLWQALQSHKSNNIRIRSAQMWETNVNLALMSHHTVQPDQMTLYRAPRLHGICRFE